jgi:hypothetical protein
MTSEVRPYNNILSKNEAGEGLMPPTGGGGQPIPHIAEMSRKTEEERGTPKE